MNRLIERMHEHGGVLIGMVHCLPMPGTMYYGGSMEPILQKAERDAHTLEASGFDAVMVEPTLDVPSGLSRGPLQIAAMAMAVSKVREAVQIPVGVSFTTPDCLDVFSIAKAAGAEFVRLTVFADTVIFPTGEVGPCAARAWEVRRDLGCTDIAVLADIQVKHARMKYPEVSLEESAHIAARQGADTIVVTGTTTGEETPIATIERVARTVNIPVVAGSGVSPENIREQMQAARGFIVGSSLKPGGKLGAEVDGALAEALVRARGPRG